MKWDEAIQPGVGGAPYTTFVFENTTGSVVDITLDVIVGRRDRSPTRIVSSRVDPQQTRTFDFVDVTDVLVATVGADTSAHDPETKSPEAMSSNAFLPHIETLKMRYNIGSIRGTLAVSY